MPEGNALGQVDKCTVNAHTLTVTVNGTIARLAGEAAYSVGTTVGAVHGSTLVDI